MKKSRVLVGSLMIMGLVGCGPNFEKGAEVNLTERWEDVVLKTDDEIYEYFRNGKVAYGLEVDSGVVNGEILLNWPSNEIATYSGDSISITRVTQLDNDRAEFKADPFFGDDCNSGATITITSNDYGLVSGEFSGNLCEEGIGNTRRLNIVGTFSASSGSW